MSLQVAPRGSQSCSPPSRGEMVDLDHLPEVFHSPTPVIPNSPLLSCQAENSGSHQDRKYTLHGVAILNILLMEKVQSLLQILGATCPSAAPKQ